MAPNRLDDLLTLEHSSRILDKEAEKRKLKWSQLYFSIVNAYLVSDEIDFQILEREQILALLFRSRLPTGTTLSL